MSAHEPAPQRSPDARFPRGKSPSGFSNAVTLGLSFVLIGFLLSIAAPGSEFTRLVALERPGETAIRVFERELEVEHAVGALSGVQRALVTAVFPGSGSAREDAVRAFGDLATGRVARPSIGGVDLAVSEEVRDALRARRAALLFEADRRDEARADLEALETAGHASFVAALRVAYARTRPDDLRPFHEYDVSVVGDEFIGLGLRLALARATAESAEADRASAALHANAERVTGRLLALATAFLVPVGVGMLLLLAWLARNRPEIARAGAPIPPAWSTEHGYAVLVRAVFWLFVLEIVLELLDLGLGVRAFTLWSTFLAAIPVVYFVRRRLFVPLGLPLAATLGLRGPSELGGPVRWIAFTLGLLALDQLGSQALTTLMRLVQADSHWAEQVVESQIWSPRAVALLENVDLCAWGPLVEEFVCRGLLYLTLRRIQPPFTAALVSGALFGAVHLYSLPGLVSVTWSGFVWALAFERCRSLWPAIACHALHNSFAAATAWALLR